MKIKPIPYEKALELYPDEKSKTTIRDYLYLLLITLWVEGEGFSGKRPLGDSGWESDLYKPLVKAGYLKGRIDTDGYWDCFKNKEEEDAARTMVSCLIEYALYGKINMKVTWEARVVNPDYVAKGIIIP
jgi:hypothetical protein